MIASAVVSALFTISFAISILCGTTLRFGIYIFQNEKHSVNFYDSESKFCAVFAAIVFGFLFVTFIFKPFRVEETEKN